MKFVLAHQRGTVQLAAAASCRDGPEFPVDLIADRLVQGARAEEILEGCPTLDKEKIAMAPLCTQLFPARRVTGRSPWVVELSKPVGRH